jgi:hypothetical protein
VRTLERLAEALARLGDVSERECREAANRSDSARADARKSGEATEASGTKWTPGG